MDTGQCLKVFAGHKKGVYPMVYIPGEDDDEEDEENRAVKKLKENIQKDLLITGSADHTTIVWCFETGKEVGGDFK